MLGALSGMVMFGALRLLYGYHETTYASAVDAQGSFFFLLLVFQMLVVLTYVAMTAIAAVWVWRAAADPRGFAPAANGALVGYCLVASWSVVVAVLYLSPRSL
jgi:hypothetical protein